MSSDSTPSKAARIELSADGGLLTAGSFALLSSVSLVIVKFVGLPIGGQAPSAFGGFLLAIAWLFGVAGTVLGPWLTWTLHNRAITVTVLAGALGGFLLSGVVVMAISFIAAIAGSLLHVVTKSEFAGPIFVLSIVIIGFACMCAWLLYDAIRDLGVRRRAHVKLDIARLVALVAAIAFSIAAAVVMRQSGGAEAGVFVLASGIYGAATVFAADLISGYLNRRTEHKAIATV